jgi:hypothetical protein
MNVVVITIIRLFMAYHRKKEKEDKKKERNFNRSISFEKESRQSRSAELPTYPRSIIVQVDYIILFVWKNRYQRYLLQ